jgi:hypothetical protein
LVVFKLEPASDLLPVAVLAAKKEFRPPIQVLAIQLYRLVV